MADASWTGLEAAAAAAKEQRILGLFERDPDRFREFSVRLDDMLLDFSKTSIDAHALTLLIELAQARGVPERRDAMLTGAPINVTFTGGAAGASAAEITGDASGLTGGAAPAVAVSRPAVSRK